MDPTFAELAGALRETVNAYAVTIAKVGDAIDVDVLDGLRRRQASLAVAVRILEDLSPHERLARSLAKVGALIDFPTFSSDVSSLRRLDVALVRALVVEVHPSEAAVRLALAAERFSNQVWVGRGDVIGIERMPPFSGR